MKKLFLYVVALVAFTISSFATTAVSANLSATNTVIVSSPSVVSKLVLYSTNATPTIVRLYDGDLTYVTAAYTNYTSYYTNSIVSQNVTTSGVTNYFTNAGIAVISVATPAATNNRTPLVTLVVPASNEPLTFEPVSPLIFSSKVNLSNNLTGLSVVLDYRSP